MHTGLGNGAQQRAVLEMQRFGTNRTRMLCERTNKLEKGWKRGPWHSDHRNLILATFIREIAICILVAEHKFDIHSLTL